MKYQVLTLTIALDEEADDYYALDQIIMHIDDDPTIRVDNYCVHNAELTIVEQPTIEHPPTQLAVPTDQPDIDELDEPIL